MGRAAKGAIGEAFIRFKEEVTHGRYRIPEEIADVRFDDVSYVPFSDDCCCPVRKVKRTPLKRKTPLKAKTSLKRTGFKAKSKTPSFKKSRTTIKQKRDYYKAKADRLWQELMYELWGHRCARCGRLLGKEEAIGHHLTKRRILHLAHHPKAGILLCNYCHNHAEDAPHNHSPELFMAFLKERYPVSYQWVQEHKNEYGKKPDYKEVCIELEEMLEKAKGGEFEDKTD